MCKIRECWLSMNCKLALNGTADGIASAMFAKYWKQGCCSLIGKWGGAYGASGVAIMEVYEI